jgi:hypothetical protein
MSSGFIQTVPMYQLEHRVHTGTPEHRNTGTPEHLNT